jgi:hypothetical protein
MPLSSLTPIHTARVLFSAALCWYCYILYRPREVLPQATGFAATLGQEAEDITKFPEIRLLWQHTAHSATAPFRWNKISTDFQRIVHSDLIEMKERTLCALEFTLRRLAISGVAERFADIIQVVSTGEKHW